MSQLFTVDDIAKAWGVTPARIRQLIAERKLLPDYTTNEPRYYWTAIPERKKAHD